MAIACHLALVCTAAAQRAGAVAPPAVKGTWEPVNYSEDLKLNDVFFVTPEVGWVAGDAGTILHTRDGGATWTAQLGGDPSAKDPPIQWIHFIDDRHGWARQHYGILLRTTDGETWERVGSGVVGGLAFISPTTGFQSYDGKIYRTRDAGRTWQEVFACRAKMEVDGLTRDVNCNLVSVNFATPKVGYAVGDARILAQTSDGGEHWRVQVGPEETGDQRAHEVFFLDEQVGFQLRWGTLYRTTDGGATWVGAVASGNFGLIRFADPEVGWSYCCAGSTRGNVIAYTTDGGRRWTTREPAFPAAVNGLSVPRRDRAYVVGEHGMIYRYRVVAGTESTSPRALPAPAMPVLDSPLAERVTTVNAEIDSLTVVVDTAARKMASDSTSVLVDTCCARSVNRLQASVDALTPLVGQFLGKYRNVNLIMAGLQLLGVLPDHVARVQAALRQLRVARGTAAAAAALTELNAAVDELRASTRQAFQQEPMTLDGGAASDGSGAAQESSVAAPADSGSAADSGAARRRVEEQARRRLEQSKRRVRIRIP
jgi:photosystem II stability/assembly factor-like uncharacterized protein